MCIYIYTYVWVIYIYIYICTYIYIDTLHYIALHYITLYYITLHHIHYISYIHTYIYTSACPAKQSVGAGSNAQRNSWKRAAEVLYEGAHLEASMHQCQNPQFARRHPPHREPLARSNKHPRPASQWG